MPFTFSHPAIVLPLAKISHRYLSVSGLVIGSLTPDFEYFIKMKLSGRFSHTLTGAFLFDLPVALAILLTFHQVVKKPLIDSLPSYFYNRLTALGEFDLLKALRENFIPYSLCILVGVFSHIGWDNLTHANAFFVDRIAFLSTPIEIKGLPVFPLFRYLQHFSTAVGGLYVIFFFHRMKRDSKINTINYYYWLMVASISVFVLWLRSTYGFEYLGDFVASSISSFFIGILAVSIAFNFYYQKR